MTPYAGAPSPARVLIVEDDDDIAGLLSLRVERAGHTAVVASSGEAALSAAVEGRPDLLVLDLVLPDADGWTLLDRLRTERDMTGVPVLVVSVLDEDSPPEREVEGYVTKPFRAGELDRQIERLLAPGGAT